MHAKLIGLVLFLAASPLTAKASVLFDIERLSDTQGILTASGSIDAGATTPNFYNEFTVNPYSSGPPPSENVSVFGSSTLTEGGFPIVFAWDCGTLYSCINGQPAIYFGAGGIAEFGPGQTFSGALNLVLTAGTTFAPVGTTGNVYWGNQTAGEVITLVGTWEMTAATATPLPAGLPLFATGLGAMGLFGWRRKRKNTAAIVAA